MLYLVIKINHLTNATTVHHFNVEQDAMQWAKLQAHTNWYAYDIDHGSMGVTVSDKGNILVEYRYAVSRFCTFD